MLDQRDISKFTKPLLIVISSKTVFFLALLIFLIAVNLTGFGTSNTVVSNCDKYLNSKVSFYQKQILIAQFVMALLGFLVSSLGLGMFGGLINGFRKQQKQKQTEKKRLSQNRIKAHFVMAFIESISVINIFSRAIQKLNEHSVCDSSNKIHFIVVLSLSIFISVTLLYVLLILFRFLTIIQQKQKALEEYTFYSDQITLQENLLFNKTGYIMQLLKLQDYTSLSNSMKDNLIKNFPSGYKDNNDFSPKRKIVYRLRGGTNQNYGAAISNMSNPKIDNEADTSNNNQLNKSRFQQNASNQGKNFQLNIMAVNNDISLDQTENGEISNYVQLTPNVIDLTVDKGLLEDLNEESEYESSEEESQEYEYQKFSIKKTGPVTPKKEKDIAQDLKIEQELRKKFNLTSNTDLRRRYAHRRNEQNIDDYGNYLYVDVQKIKKKSKLLNFNEETNNIDPNTLYGAAEIVPRQKKLSKKHEKYVAEYLKKLNKLKKQEMLFKEESSQQNDQEFEEQSEQSKEQEEEKQESSQLVDTIPVTVIDPVTGQPMTVIPQKNKKNQDPQLYLYIKKRKNPGRDHKLKLYEDEEDFYDSENSKENQQKQGEGANSPEKGLAESNANGEKMGVSGTSKEHQLEKSKHQQKLVIANKHLQTHEARLLRFIRRKYISREPQFLMPEMGNIIPSNINGFQAYHQNYDPNLPQNMNPNQGMIQGFNPINPGIAQTKDLGQNQNLNQNALPTQFSQPYQNNSQPHQKNSFEANVFSPPPENIQMSPIKQNLGSGPYQMSSPQQSPPGFSTPFNMHTPLPLNQKNSQNQMSSPNYQLAPLNNQPPPSYNQNYTQPNLMASMLQPTAPSHQPPTK